MRGMSMVVAYARAQVGKRYVRGGEGPNSFDCSGFTKRAYARAGLRLPHSSGRPGGPGPHDSGAPRREPAIWSSGRGTSGSTWAAE